MPARDFRNHQLPLLTSTVWRMVGEDPVFFALQVSRKLPGSVRGKLGAFGKKIPTTSVGEFLQLLADIPVEITHHNRFSEEMRVAKGIEPSDDARAETRARHAWNIGNVTEAIDMLPKCSSLRRRYEDEKRVLEGDAFQLEHVEPAPHDAKRVDVLHVLVNSAPHTSSGYTVRTRAILTGQRDRGLKVAGVTRIAYPITIGGFFPNAVDVVDGIPYFRLLPKTLPEFPVERLHRHAQMLSDLVTKLRPRALHATTNYTNAVVAKAVAEAHGIPWVYEMRGQLEKTWVARHPTERQEQVASSERYRLMLDKETALAKAANGVVVLSHVQCDDLIERGVEPAKIHVIANAYTPQHTEAKLSPEQAREELGLPQEFSIGSVTSIVDYEGLDTLIRAIGLLRDRGIKARAVIAGDGVARPGLQTLVSELGLDDHVSLPGRVTREQSHLWYQALEVFAVPRKDTLVCRTITPIKPIEAMSNGTPVVASDLPPLRELVVDSGAGIAFEPGNAAEMADAIESLLDPETYLRTSEAAIANAADHTWDRNIDRYLDLYEELWNEK